MEILEGEIYKDRKTGKHYYILAIYDEAEEYIELAALTVDPKTYETLQPVELTVKTKDLEKWELVSVD